MARERQPFGFEPRPDPVLSDRDLVAQARVNPEAFGRLYKKYLDKVYSYHFYRLGSPQAAEDATEDTFLKAITHFDSFQYTHEQSFSAWIFRIAHNENANLHRGRAKKPIEPISKALESRLLSPFGQPEEELEDNEEKRRVRELVLSLPPEQRDIILLRFVGGFQNKEIGEILKITEGAVKARIHRIITGLREKF